MKVNDKLICIKNFDLSFYKNKFIAGNTYTVLGVSILFLIGDQNVNMLFDQNNLIKYFITEEEFRRRNREYRKTKLNKILKSNE